MEDKEICIIVLDEENNEHLLTVQNDIKYEDLKNLINTVLNKNNDFEILYQDQIIEETNKVIHLDENEIIYLVSKDEDDDNDIHDEIYVERPVNIKFHEDKSIEDDDDGDMKTIDLSGLLKLCLLIHISKNMDDYTIGNIESDKLIDIIFTLRKMEDDKTDIKEDIKNVLSQKNGSNILSYSSYVNSVIDKKEINNLVNLFKGDKKKEIIRFWSKLSKYNDFNKLFEMNFSKALEMSYFEYTLVSLSIIEKKNRKNYLDSKKKCNNCKTQYLFHGTQIDPISNIVTNGFFYTRKAFYGMGVYFSDMLDYIGFYCGGKTYEERRANFGKTIKVGETFSCIASETYYDKTKKKEIYNWDYLVPEIKDHFPTYEELKQKYSSKMVKKNGIHYIRIEPEKGQVKKKNDIPLDEKKGNFIGTEFVITEMDQILPLYGLTLKRSEYFVLWRDSNFSRNNDNSKQLKEIINELNKTVEMNIYCFHRTEKALELISRKKYNKMILITNVGNDYGGRTFIEKAREILGFDVIILFFTGKHHLNWIQNYKNALYTNDKDLCIEYVTNYNKKGLIALKGKIEKFHKIKLREFTEDFLQFPKFVNQKKYCELKFDIIKENFRKVIILKKRKQKALFMSKDGNVSFLNVQGKDVKPYIWYVTIFANEISFYSNHFYLSGFTEINTVLGEEYNSKKWKFKIVNNEYMFYLDNENNILTVDENGVTLSKFNQSKLQSFTLFDIK